MNALYLSKSSFFDCEVRRFLKVYIKFYDGSFEDLRTENVCLDIFEVYNINLKIRNVQLQNKPIIKCFKAEVQFVLFHWRKQL